ncbi:uncharacterized protein LOC143259509 [Megalopta genalis]|uniref:uncharacterized protein LOC143259509 n=1 Tax=Megalopta genalis TaxID=115081 RepID=UPI003FD5566B
MDNDTKRAYGVQFRIDGVSYKTVAIREVILSAGALQSQQLHLLSCIGPKDHLDVVGVKIVHDVLGTRIIIRGKTHLHSICTSPPP